MCEDAVLKRVDDRSQDDCQEAELADGLRRERERQDECSGRTAIVKYAGLGCWGWATGIPCQDFETRSSSPVHVPFVSRFPWASPPTVAPGHRASISHNRPRGCPSCPIPGWRSALVGVCMTGGVRHEVRVRMREGCTNRVGCHPKLLAQRRRLICRTASSPSLPILPISSAIVMVATDRPREGLIPQLTRIMVAFPKGGLCRAQGPFWGERHFGCPHGPPRRQRLPRDGSMARAPRPCSALWREAEPFLGDGPPRQPGEGCNLHPLWQTGKRPTRRAIFACRH